MALVRPQLHGPGVYLQEVPSGVHTVIGVPTSITAFLGRTLRGPVGEPVPVSSFDEFQSQFGGLARDSYVPYCVQDFFLNGGATAIIVRLASSAKTASFDAAPASGGSGPTVVLTASSPGKWGNGLSATTDAASSALLVSRFKTQDWDATDLFNLTITLQNADGSTETERIQNVSLKKEAAGRYLGTVLADARFARYLEGAAAGQGTDSAGLVTADYDGGLAALKHVDIFNLLCIPPDQQDGSVDTLTLSHAVAACKDGRATLVVDPPTKWNAAYVAKLEPDAFTADLGITVSDEAARFAAVYYPRVLRPDPLLGGSARTFPVCGLVAGVIARTDASRGVWKAPAGFSAGLSGIQGLAEKVDDLTSGHMNEIGVNCLRTFAASGPVVWGARTARGSDIMADDYKYLPVRRLADYIESTLLRSTMWAVFEPNDEPLWAQLRLSIGSFMGDLFRQGAFQGSSRDKAYFVKCDATTTLQSDIDAGIVNVQIGFAPLKPAEFVILYLSQIAGGDS